MKTDRIRWTVVSPDGVPIAPETYPSEDAARKALAAWCGRYEAQGYYASVSGRIALADLPGRCPVESDETPDPKFARIAQEIKSNADWRALLAGTYDDELTALDEIAKHYGGENTHTGGNIYVVLIALGAARRDGRQRRGPLPLSQRDAHRPLRNLLGAGKLHQRERGLAVRLKSARGIRRRPATKTKAPDVLIANERTVFTFCPLSAAAKTWFEENVQADAYQWFGNVLCVETRFAWGSAVGLKDAGFVLE